MFLEYIVENGHVTKEQLLLAIAGQMESMPSLIRLLLEEGKCSADQVYGLLIEGAKKNSSLFEMIKSKNVLSDSELHEFLNKQNFQSKSLGELLITQGSLSKDQYDQILRDYASVKDSYVSKESSSPIGVEESVKPVSEEASIKSEEETPQASPAPAPAVAGGISAAALESLMAVQDIDQDMLAQLEGSVGASPVSEDQVGEKENEVAVVSQEEEVSEKDNSGSDGSTSDDVSPTLGEYLDFYSEPLQSELLVTANRYRLKGKMRDLEFLHENILKILSLAKLNGFEFQAKLLEPYDNYIGELVNRGAEGPEDWRYCPSEMFELLWDFRKTIVEGKSEGQLLAISNNKEKYINNLKTVMSYIKRSA